MRTEPIDQATSPKTGFQLTGFQKHSIFVICFLLYLINNIDRQVLSVVIEPMKADLGLSDAQAGLLHTVFFLSMAAFSFPVAFIVDRWSRRKSLALMAIVWSVFTYVTGLGRSFIGVLIPRMFVGIGEAGFPPAGTALLSSAYSEKVRGRVLGLFTTAIPLGTSLGMILGGVIAGKTGNWRSPFFIFAIPGILFGILAFFLKDYKTVKLVDQAGKRASFLADIKTLFKTPSLKWMIIGYTFHFGMINGFLVWIPAFVMRTRGLPISEAGMFAGTIGIMALLGSPLGGIWADLWQKRNKSGRIYVMVIGPVAAAITILISIFLELKGIGYPVAMISGVFLVMCTPAAASVSQEVVGPAHKAIAWALAGFFGMLLGASWSPSVIGGISDALGSGAHGLKTAMMIVLPPLGIIAGICFSFCARTYSDDKLKMQGYTLEAE